MYVFELSQDLWNNSNQEVNSFSIRESGNEHDVDLVGVARFLDILLPNGWVGREFIWVDGVRNCESLPRIKFGPEHEIVFAGMTNANSGIQVPEAPFHQFIQVDTSEVVVAEKGMFSEDGFEAHWLGGHQYDVLKDAYALVPVHNFDLLADQYLSDEGHRVEESHESDIAIAHWLVRNMIHFHTIGHIPDSAARALELISDECYFVATLYQALA